MKRLALSCALVICFSAHAELIPKAKAHPQTPESPKAESRKVEPVKKEASKAESLTTLSEPTSSASGSTTVAAPANDTSKTAPTQHAAVLKWDKRKDRMAIGDDPKRPWNKGDNVCAFRVGRAVACGKVVAVGYKGAVVQLQTHTAPVKPNDEARYFEPEKKIPQISDEDILAEGLMDAKPYTFNLAVGYSLSLDLMFPVAHFYWAVSPTIAIGIQPAYISRSKAETAGESKLSGYGGALTINYFSQEYFRGMWLQIGSGFYHLTATPATGVEETINTPLVTALIGWREDWAHGLNVGAAVGGRFLSPLQLTTTSEIKYNSLYPLAQVELGLSF